MPTPPINPGYFDKVNFVIDAWSRPCEAPWYIYVETLKPAALEAFITLATFGWDDVARGYFRPRDLGRRRSGKRKPRRFPIGKFFPELGEEIGKRLPMADEVKGAKWSELGKTLWRIDSAIQAGLFWWLVADVTIDFAFNWTSLLYETAWCRASAFGRFSVFQVGVAIISGGFWTKLVMTGEDYDVGKPSFLVFTGSTGVNSALVGFAVDVLHRSGQPAPTGYESRITSDVAPFVHASSPSTTWVAGERNSAVLSGTVPPNATFAFEIKVSGTPFANYSDAVGTGMENQS